MPSQTEYKPCAGCGVMGYTDERSYSKQLKGHLCIRCSRPDIDWTNAKTWIVEESYIGYLTMVIL
jgi:hypothetical protein